MNYKQLSNGIFFFTGIVLIVSTSVIIAGTEPSAYKYAVVCSDATYQDNGWKIVADSLLKKHARSGSSKIFYWSSRVTDVKAALSEFQPDYIAYLARPATECNSSFVVAVHRLSRSLDSDPYGDAVWGIVTAAKSEDALRAISESLMVKTVLAASSNLSYEPPIQRFYQAVGMTCDSYTKTDYLFSGAKGSVFSEEKRPENEQDRIKLVSKWLSAESLDLSVLGKGALNGPVDCIITGGHGNVNLWQCHYPEAGNEGYMRSSNGKLMGDPYSGNTIEINAKTPKVYWCASNCLMGNPNSKDNIVYGAFGSGHAVQMFGFVNNASSGDEFMAWGVYDRVTKRAGALTLPQGYFLSNNNALFEIRNPGNELNTGLVETFMDSTVFYGDPAGDVRFYAFGDSAHAYKTAVTLAKGNDGYTEFTYAYTMLAHDLEFGAGYCYQFRPIELLPVRIDPSTVEVTNNEGHKCEITDNLLVWQLLSSGEKLTKGKSKTLSWRAKITDMKTGIITKAVSEIRGNSPVIQSVCNGAGPFVVVDNLIAGKYTVFITDISGKVRFSKTFESSGNYKSSISIGNKLLPGAYCVSFKGEHKKIYNTKMIIEQSHN